MESPDLETFIHDVGLVVSETDDQYVITERVAPLLSALLASGYTLPPEFVRPAPDRHVNYPLYIAPDDSWCLVSVVWNAGQRTPVHGHETWGVVGIYSGVEREIRYLKPGAADAGPLTPAGEQVWRRGHRSHPMVRFQLGPPRTQRQPITGLQQSRAMNERRRLHREIERDHHTSNV